MGLYADCGANSTTLEVQSQFDARLGPSRRQQINVAVIFSATLSLLGSSFIIVSWSWFPHLRTPAFRLIMWLSVADWLHSLCYLVDGARTDLLCPDDLCYVLAAWNQFFSLATYLWTAVIAHNMFIVLVSTLHRGATLADDERRLRRAHWTVWGSAAALTVAAAGSGALGLAGQWCWISEGAQWARGALYFAPLLLIFAYNGLAYRRIAHAVRVSAPSVRAAVNVRLRFYLTVFFIATVPSVINRAQNLMAPDRPSFALYMLQSVSQPLLGLGNALVYGFHRRVRAAYAEALRQRGFRRCARLFNAEGAEDGALAKINGRRASTSSGGAGGGGARGGAAGDGACLSGGSVVAMATARHDSDAVAEAEGALQLDGVEDVDVELTSSSPGQHNAGLLKMQQTRA
eukprot:g1810.t1